MREILLKIIPTTSVIIALIIGWTLATLIESARWKRHIKRFLPQEALQQIEQRDEEIDTLRTELQQTKEDRDHMACQMKIIREGLEI